MNGIKLDVIKNARLYVGISSTIILTGLVAMVISFQQLGSPLRLGIDFTGGSNVTLSLTCNDANKCTKIDVSMVRQALSNKGFGNSVIQLVEGKELQGVSVRTARLSVEQREDLKNAIADVLKQYGQVDPQKSQIASCLVVSKPESLPDFRHFVSVDVASRRNFRIR